MRTYPQSNRILERNCRSIPGGMFSLNRETDPGIVFTKADGALLWDADDNRYIDYHAAFAPFLLGHNHPEVNAAVERVLRDGTSLFGVNTTAMEGELADLICQSVPFADQVGVLNTGSEATYQAIRAARAYTSRDHIIVMQGGYNGWHNDVACNLMTPIAEIGPAGRARLSRSLRDQSQGQSGTRRQAVIGQPYQPEARRKIPSPAGR